MGVPTRCAIWLLAWLLTVGLCAAGDVIVYTANQGFLSRIYVLDADASLSAGRFAMRALVSQATGADWGGVSLRLTTAPRSARPAPGRRPRRGCAAVRERSQRGGVRVGLHVGGRRLAAGREVLPQCQNGGPCL